MIAGIIALVWLGIIILQGLTILILTAVYVNPVTTLLEKVVGQDDNCWFALYFLSVVPFLSWFLLWYLRRSNR